MQNGNLIENSKEGDHITDDTTDDRINEADWVCCYYNY